MSLLSEPFTSFGSALLRSRVFPIYPGQGGGVICGPNPASVNNHGVAQIVSDVWEVKEEATLFLNQSSDLLYKFLEVDKK